MTVLVAGGTGFVGSALCADLVTAGHDVLCLSRSGQAPPGTTALVGDVTRPSFGLDRASLERVRRQVTHIVLSAGSVDWGIGPSATMSIHGAGTDNALALARSLANLERVVLVSSVLVMGKARRPVANRDLHVGQDFRNWYEYGKYLAEAQVRSSGLPYRVVRFGPVLGGPLPWGVGPSGGMLAAVPLLVQGYPVHLARGGRFPAYVCDVTTAAAVLAAALDAPQGDNIWTWFDPSLPTLSDVFVALTTPWNVLPRIVDAPVIGRLGRAVAGRLATPRELFAYAEPWLDLAPEILAPVPQPWPEPSPNYLAQTAIFYRQRLARSGMAGV